MTFDHIDRFLTEPADSLLLVSWLTCMHRLKSVMGAISCARPKYASLSSPLP